MPITLNTRGGGTQRVGFVPRAGGGYERGVIEERDSSGNVVSRTPGGVSSERGSLIRDRLAREQASKQSEQVAAPVVAQTASVPAPRVVNPIVPKNASSPLARMNNQPFMPPTVQTGTSTSVIPQQEYYTGSSILKNERVVQPAVKESGIAGLSQTLREKSAVKTIETQRAESQGRSPSPKVIATSFLVGAAIPVVSTAQALANPVETTKSTAAKAFSYANKPSRIAEDLASTGAAVKANPALAAGRLTGEAVVSKGVDIGFKGAAYGVNELKFIGKTELPQTEIAPSFLSGKEKYPTGTPQQTVSLINKQGYAYSASPERLAKGEGTVTVLTQAEKKAAGLPLSETGGLYAAGKISPQFTGLVERGDTYARPSLLPTFGTPGSIQRIQTKASLLPESVVSKGFSEANKYLDTAAASQKPGVAFASPATQIRGKTEAEVIIPGGSKLVRPGYESGGGFKVLVGADFDKFVRVPVKFDEAGAVLKTRKVPVREYVNLGSKEVPKGYLADFDSPGYSYKASRSGALPASSLLLTSSKPVVTPVSSSAVVPKPSRPVSVRYNEASVSGPSVSSRSISRTPTSTISRPPVTSTYSSYRRSIVERPVVPSYAPPSRPSYSVSKSFPTVVPPGVPKGGFEDYKLVTRLKVRDPKKYTPGFTAAAFNVGGGSVKRRTGFSGFETRGLLSGPRGAGRGGSVNKAFIKYKRLKI
jgi:hypothetical protein